MKLNDFISKLSSQPETVSFTETMAVIDQSYQFTPTAFSNGGVENGADQNNGSCKIFAFGQLNKLTQEQTLACFGDYYRNDVLNHPDADDHQNIRCFMKSGWTGVQFQGPALSLLNNG